MKNITFFKHTLKGCNTVGMKVPREHWFNPHDIQLIIRFQEIPNGLKVGVDFIDNYGSFGTYWLPDNSTVGLNLYGRTTMSKVKSAWDYIRHHKELFLENSYLHTNIDYCIKKNRIRERLSY